MKNRADSSGYIKKHKKHIDYRIASLSDYVSLKSSKQTAIEQIISDLISAESQESVNTRESGKTPEALAELKVISASWDILNDGDLAGYIYQNLQSCSSKKNKGQFFTPDDIVNYIVRGSLINLAKNISDVKVLDPSCGSGQFLIGYYNELYKNLSAAGFQKSRIPLKIIENIYGFDTDATAVKIAKFNLSKISGVPVEKINIFENDFLDKSVLPFYKKRDALKFDIVAGNPPWGSKIKDSQKNYYRDNYITSSSGINTFSLFIERSSDFIDVTGKISFLVPEAFLNIKAHMASRKFVLDNFCIEEISLWGEKFKGVFAPSVSVTLRKEKSGIIQSNIVKINSNKKSEAGTQRLIPQHSYSITPENIFNINYSTRSAGIISSIENADAVFLKDRAKFFLGIVTGDNNRLISDKESEEQPDPILVGTDLEKYRINFSNHFFKYDTDKLQQVAPVNLYKSRDKILYKFIGKNLTFARDTDGYFTLNNVNGFIPSIENIEHDSLVAILNSRIMQYYYEKSFFTVKVLKGNLEKLPIRIPDIEIQKRIRRLTENIRHSVGLKSEERENIEDIIQHVYGIKDRDAYRIELPATSSGENEI